MEVLANDLNPATTTVGSIIRHPVVVAQDSEEPATALERMRTHGVRRIPIVSQHNRLVGILTVDDLLRLLATDSHTLTEIVSRQRPSREARQAMTAPSLHGTRCRCTETPPCRLGERSGRTHDSRGFLIRPIASRMRSATVNF